MTETVLHHRISRNHGCREKVMPWPTKQLAKRSCWNTGSIMKTTIYYVCQSPGIRLPRALSCTPRMCKSTSAVVLQECAIQQVASEQCKLLSCMHRPVQPKSLSWWREVGNLLIFQHSPSRGSFLRPQTWNRSKQQLFYLIALTKIRTQDLTQVRSH